MKLKHRNADRTDDGPILLPAAGAAGRDSDDALEVVVTRLDVESEVVRASATLLSETERRRAARFAFDRDRRRFTVARARLRQLLAARLGIAPESVEFSYGAHGKPALAAHCASQDLRFNLSHSDDFAVYAFAFRREVGIDLEAVRTVRGADGIAALFFSRREHEAYLALDPRDRPRGFFNCWTRKEALVKAIGDGLGLALDHFDVSLAPGEPARILRVGRTPGEHCGWRMASFSPAPGLVAAVASEIPGCRADSAMPRSARPALAP